MSSNWLILQLISGHQCPLPQVHPSFIHRSSDTTTTDRRGSVWWIGVNKCKGVHILSSSYHHPCGQSIAVQTTWDVIRWDEHTTLHILEKDQSKHSHYGWRIIVRHKIIRIIIIIENVCLQGFRGRSSRDEWATSLTTRPSFIDERRYTKNPSIHPPIPSYCVSPDDLSSRVIKSSRQAHRIIRGRTIKVQKLSISWSISEQPLRRSFNCFCWCCPVEYAAEDFALTESQRMADGHKNPQQIWGFGWLHLNWLYLSKMLFMTHS